MALLVFALAAALVTTGQGCQQVAVCDGGVDYTNYDLHEETRETVLASGHKGLVRCNLAGGQGQILEENWRVKSALVTHDGTIWAAASDSTQYQLYRQDTAGNWHKELVNDNLNPTALDVDSNGQLVVMSSMNMAVYHVQLTPEPAVVSTLNLTAAATWKSVFDLAVLPSGSVAVNDGWNNCAHILSRDGHVENTMGTCGSPGSNWGQLYKPTGITTDNNGNIVIAEFYNNRISVFNSTGTPVKTICQGEELQYPQAVLVTSGGLLVVGEHNGKVKVFKYDD